MASWVRPVTTFDRAVEILIDEWSGHGLPRVSIPQAARRAGYSAGAAYRHWPDQTAFERDVVAEALRRRDRPSVTKTVTEIRELVDRGAELQEVICVGAGANLYEWPDDATYFKLLALRTSVCADPEMRDVGRIRLDTGLAEYTYLYDAMLKLWNRRVRAPLTTAHVALAFAARGEGLRCRLRWHRPPHVRRA